MGVSIVPSDASNMISCQLLWDEFTLVCRFLFDKQYNNNNNNNNNFIYSRIIQNLQLMSKKKKYLQICIKNSNKYKNK